MDEKEIEELLKTYFGKWSWLCVYEPRMKDAARAIAEGIREGIRWEESFELNESGHIYVRAQSGYNDDGQYWLDDFWNPGQRVTVTVKEEKDGHQAD